MSITKEVLEVEEQLQNKIKNIFLFLGIKADIQKGNIINIDNTNIAYIEPHKVYFVQANASKNMPSQT